MFYQDYNGHNDGKIKLPDGVSLLSPCMTNKFIGVAVVEDKFRPMTVLTNMADVLLIELAG